MMRRRDFLRSGSAAALAALAPRAIGVAAPTGAYRVIVAGGGFAGAACALQLRRLNAAIDVTVIDPSAEYVTCPMSNEVLIGARSLPSITVLRRGLSAAGVRCVRDRVAGVNPDARSLRLDSGKNLAYDRLVVAPGIRFLWGTPEGYDEAAAQQFPHAWQAGAQTALFAAQLRGMRNGGIVAISVPFGLMRCPPGPYERASLIAGWLREHKPRSKVLIFDANNHFPRQDVFTAAWNERYPGLIEWIPVTQGGRIERIDVKKSTLYTSQGGQRVAVANIIPPQAPGQLAVDAGLATGHGWCAVKPQSFESVSVPNVHVIGDACIAGAMPKSASAAHSQALQCAAAIAAMADGREVPSASFDSVCFSLLDAQRALAIRGRFEVRDGEIRQVEGPATGAESEPERALDRRAADDWYGQIRADTFGE